MIQVYAYVFGLWIFLVLLTVIVWFLSIDDDKDNWQSKVTAEDLEELGRLLREE
jgi:hypothetical protein